MNYYGTSHKRSYNMLTRYRRIIDKYYVAEVLKQVE